MVGMTDRPENSPPIQKERANSPLAKACFNVVKAIRFIADNTDRELGAKIGALLIALGYLVAVVVIQRAITPAVPLAVVLLVPLGFIWFPEEVGGFTGYVSRGGTIDAETPPALVSFIGWLLLVGLPTLAFCSWLAGWS